jgi:hypothetical protein
MNIEADEPVVSLRRLPGRDSTEPLEIGPQCRAPVAMHRGHDPDEPLEQHR